MSFKKRRKALLQLMMAKQHGHAVVMVVRFRNQDVPNFLRRLSEFERASRKSRLIVR